MRQRCRAGGVVGEPSTSKGRSRPPPGSDASPSLLRTRIARGMTEDDPSRGKTLAVQGSSGVGPPGFEPGTSSLSGMRSNRAELWALETVDAQAFQPSAISDGVGAVRIVQHIQSGSAV